MTQWPTESEERAREWDTARVGDRVDLLGPDNAPACGYVFTDPEQLVCTRDEGHGGTQHVATGNSEVLAVEPMPAAEGR